MKPVCEDDLYELDQEKCECVKKAKECPPGKIRNPNTGRCINQPKVKTTRKRCPKGKVKNPKTGRCINKPKTKTTRKRCPRGTRRNKNTGNCDPPFSHDVVAPPSAPNNYNYYESYFQPSSPVVVKSSTPQIQESVGNEIMRELSSPRKSPPAKTASIKQLVRSFSPIINQKLVAKKKGSVPTVERNSLFECASSKKRGKWSMKVSDNVPPEIMVDGQCESVFAEESQNILLDRLAYTHDNIKMEDVTSPKQFSSNCWFNTMFMVFFVSNKGRKFFKFFRQLMIEGVTADGHMPPQKIRNALAYFNLAIEASMTPGVNILDTFNTNHIIRDIYKNIPRYQRVKNIKRPGQAGNPLSYYKSLIKYLTQGSSGINMLSMYFDDEDDVTDKTIEGTVKQIIGLRSYSDVPEVVIVAIHDEMSKKHRFDKREISSTIHNATYKLDSAIVRDTDRGHFCALLQVGKDECGFDGASFRKLSKFNWKKHLGENTEWTFEGSNWNNVQGDPIMWNFRSGYYLLFYYRI